MLALSPGADALRVIPRNREADQDFAFVDGFFDARIAVDEALDLEEARAAEALDQRAAVGAVVARRRSAWGCGPHPD